MARSVAKFLRTQKEKVVNKCRAKMAKEISVGSRGATDENSPQFQLRVKQSNPSSPKGATDQNHRRNSVVPPGLMVIIPANPQLKLRAIFVRPFGTPCPTHLRSKEA
jgi:hypothetical protein